MNWRDTLAGKISATKTFGSRGRQFGSNEIQLVRSRSPQRGQEGCKTLFAVGAAVSGASPQAELPKYSN
jgi:hypothetical protein